MDYHHQALVREAELEQVRLATEHALRTDPRYQPYLAGYTPASVEVFIQHYARHKVRCLEQGPNMVKFRLHQVIEYQEDAYERLFDVQRKKLFDLQVRWRAGEITLPGIQTYQQFESWQRAGIHRCPFLPPITRAEYELYRDWLTSDACQEFANHQDHHRDESEWQDYNAMHNEWDLQQNPPPAPSDEDIWKQYCDYPAWFAYYDARIGAPPGYPFATHPNQRGKLQDHYMNLAREEKWVTDPPKPYIPDPRPDVMGGRFSAPDAFDDAPDRYLTEDDWHFDEFTRRFDADPENLLAYRQAMLRTFNDNYNNVLNLTNQNLELLGDARGPWPVAAHYDWRQGIYAAAAQLHRELLLAALPAVFDDYEFRIQTGLQPAPPDEYRAYHDTQTAEDPDEYTIMPYLEKGILRGRELAGEARDFDY